MNLPAPTAGVTQAHARDALPFRIPPASDAASQIAAALAMPTLTDGAFRLYAAALLATPAGQWVSSLDLAAAIGMRDHEARQRVAELVRVGLLQRRRMAVVLPNGVAAERNRYRITPGGAR